MTAIVVILAALIVTVIIQHVMFCGLRDIVADLNSDLAELEHRQVLTRTGLATLRSRVAEGGNVVPIVRRER